MLNNHTLFVLTIHVIFGYTHNRMLHPVALLMSRLWLPQVESKGQQNKLQDEHLKWGGGFLHSTNFKLLSQIKRYFSDFFKFTISVRSGPCD